MSWLISPLDKMAPHFADDIFRCIFVNEKFCILIKISLKFVPKGSIDNNPGLAPNRPQAIIWINSGPIHWHIYAALGGDELKHVTFYFTIHYSLIMLHFQHKTITIITPKLPNDSEALGGFFLV